MKRSNIWILNHYATHMFKEQGGRHFWFAENLMKRDYRPTVFCASTIHNSDRHMDTYGRKFSIETVNNIPFVFVQTPNYEGNGTKRIMNMFTFYRNLLQVAKEYAQIYGKPDVILASSVHPLTLLAGVQIGRKFGIPCICEVRDLWPESIVAYGSLKRSSIVAKGLYLGEKWIYKKADAIIMTWEGGKDYIVEQGWDTSIDVTKVVHINNGIVIDSFDKNIEGNPIIDSDLDDINFKNIVYTGSIRKVNNLGIILDVAKLIQNQGNSNIKFLIYGSGNESDMLKNRCKDEGINNVIFKGSVDKKYIPSILNKAHANILHNSSTSLDKYGQSQNKLFEYLAAGKCIIQTYTTGYSICDRYKCGLSSSSQQAEEIAKIITDVCSNDELARLMGQNARRAAFDFDFNNLTQKLVEVIKSV